MMKENKLLIVIPARGGSKGFPGKNCKYIGGIPLLSWSWDAVKASGLQNPTCILSTDDEEIAKIGRSVGLDVPFLRPKEIASDTATVEEAALHAMEYLEKKREFFPDAIMWLQPTQPFRNPRSLKKAFDVLNENPNLKSVIGVMAIYRDLSTLYYGDEKLNLTCVDIDAKHGAVHRQQFKPIYTPDGTVYIMRAAVLRETKTRFSFPMRGIVTEDPVEFCDIDYQRDLDIADAIHSAGLTWRNIC